MYETNYYPVYKRNTELYHHGILGMKWGVRRYQPYGEGGYNPKNKHERNKDYSDTQRKQDRAFYGKGAERRINRKMNEGKNIITARHEEIQRRKRINAGKKFVGIAGTLLAYDYIINGKNSLVSKGSTKAKQLIRNELKTKNISKKVKVLSNDTIKRKPIDLDALGLYERR